MSINVVRNAEGEILGTEYIYPPDEADYADWLDAQSDRFDDGPDGPFDGCCERGDGTGRTVGETDENGYQFSALTIFICDYCRENVSGWYYENPWGPWYWDNGYRQWVMPFPDVPRC